MLAAAAGAAQTCCWQLAIAHQQALGYSELAHVLAAAAGAAQTCCWQVVVAPLRALGCWEPESAKVALAHAVLGYERVA